MNSSELLTPGHLARRAIIYVRQSSPHQVLSNQESRRLQYALKERARSLGWQPDNIQLIDSDLGRSATHVDHREGFKEMASEVALGHVGLILSYNVDRLSRNCSDWFPLLDVCAYRNCLIADQDSIYDPASPNGRLLLGIKGQLSEMELHTIRARLTAGILNKAQRGELALKLPVGLIRDESKKVVKDPNEEVQRRTQLIFSSFLTLRSASKVLRFFNEQELCIPRQDRFGELVWKKPTVAAILSTLKNPAYAGAFVYGRTRATRKDSSPAEIVQRPIPREEWKVLIKEKYPAYISWETYEKMQLMLRDNYAEYDRNKTRGIPRPGAALLHGILYCGECGHKMVVQYKNSTRYICNYLRQQYGVTVCQYIPADAVDSRVVEAFFEVLSPIELDAFDRALAAQKERDEKLCRAHQQQIERLRYEAALAERQFNRVDPDNRLVAAELEKRWESALASLRKAEQTHEQLQRDAATPEHLSPELKDAFRSIGESLPELWKKGLLSSQHKKALLRCLIDKVVVHRCARDCVQARIVWKGGDTTTLKIPINVNSFAELSAAGEMERIILNLSRQGKADEQIACHLTELGYRSPLRKHVLPSTVKTIRLKHRLLQNRSQSHPRRIQGYLTVPQLTKLLDLPQHWIYYQIDKGSIHIEKDAKTGLYLFPDTPETLQRLIKLLHGKLRQLSFLRGYQDA